MRRNFDKTAEVIPSYTLVSAIVVSYANPYFLWSYDAFTNGIRSKENSFAK